MVDSGVKKIQWNIFNDLDGFEKFLEEQNITEFETLSDLFENNLIDIQLIANFRRTPKQFFTFITNEKQG